MGIVFHKIRIDIVSRRTLMVPMQVTIPFLGFAIADFVFCVASSLTKLNLSAVCAYWPS